MSVRTSPLRPDDFAGANLSIQKGLEAIRTHLGMTVAYVSEFVGDKSVFRVVDAPGLEAVIKPGDEKPIDDVFCRHILAGRLPELMPDVSANPFAMTIPIMQQVPIGAHMSVPIRLEGGETYGMFCCLSLEKDPSLNDRDLSMMRVFADMAAHQIAEDVKCQKSLLDKSARIEEIIGQRLFTPVFQPICDLSTGGPVGFEALCRFRPEPYRSPDKWFAEAAEVGRGIDLELAVMQQALAEAAILPAEVYLSVNASPELLVSGRLKAVIAGRANRRILVEVTEHDAVADYAVLSQALAELREAGALIAIDDAGSGYSSLQHIVQIKPEFIKIDTSLVREIDKDPARRALMAALIFFARETASTMIAEGVETEAERVMLTTLGVTKAQGYLFSKPMPIAEAAALLDRRADGHRLTA